jgi:23S rRNA pseudouridine2604 synthase
MEPVRLSKRMAELGICSRREADSYIEQGWVKVDGEVAVLGQKVLPHNTIEVLKKAQDAQSSRVTILLNKPVGYVSGQAERAICQR